MVEFTQNRPQLSLIGLFGKIPSRGDFMSSALPRSFQDKVENWVRGGFAAANKNPDWHKAYLSSPIWQFAAARGFFDNNAWCGIIMPSVDSVGRNFPMVIAMQTDAVRQDVLQTAQNLAQEALASTINVAAWENEVVGLGALDVADGPTRFCSPPAGAYFQAVGYDGDVLTKHFEDSATPQVYAKLIGANALPTEPADGYLL